MKQNILILLSILISVTLFSQDNSSISEISKNEFSIGNDTMKTGMELNIFLSKIDTSNFKIEKIISSGNACGVSEVKNKKGKVVTSEPYTETIYYAEIIINWIISAKFKGSSKEKLYLEELDFFKNKDDQ